MVKETIIGLVALLSTALASSPSGLISPLAKTEELVLVEHQLDLTERHEEPEVNKVFAYNLLLALEYFDNGFDLQPGETFAFHETVLSEFENQFLKTGPSHFTKGEGYQTTLGLPGNGICHLASLINWTATEAGLEVTSRINHDFAIIPGIPKEYGTSIRYTQDGSLNSRGQNLYVVNNKSYSVRFDFEVVGKSLELRILARN